MEKGIAETARSLWLAERRQGIGGTDAAAILGVSRFLTPYEVYLDKRGELPAQPDSGPLWWGRALEDVIARRYTEVTRTPLVAPGRIFAHPQHAMLIGTPDRVAVNSDLGVEVKNVGPHADGWGEPGTDEVPVEYAVQCHHYMLVLGFARWHIAALFGGNDFRIYRLRWDQKFADLLLETLPAWWRRHVVAGVPPGITGAASVSRALARRYPQDVGPLVEATMDDAEALALWHSARSVMSAAGDQERAAANRLKARIGSAAGIRFPNGDRVTWQSSASFAEVDWQSVVDAIAPRVKGVDVTAIIREATTVQPGSRRFLFRPAREDE